MPSLVTFDCAQTIVEVHWAVDRFAGDCMKHLGHPVTDEQVAQYGRLFNCRLPEFLAVNLRRDPSVGVAFWRQLGIDWLNEIGQPSDLIEPLMQTSDHLAYGDPSILFKAFDDVIPCFERLRRRGVRLAVVSNWDYSLHRVLRMFGFDAYLELALASLEEGVEKPDPRLFHIALDRLGVRPEQTVHVGDNPLDDVEGAKAAGIHPVLIDRNGVGGDIKTLDQLEEAVGWID